MGQLWTGVLITLGLFCVAGIVAGGEIYIPAFVAIVIGGAMFVNAGLFESRILLAAAGAWWLCSIAMLVFPEQSFLLNALALFLGYLWPAFLLHRQTLSEEDGREAR
jgi:hypothetical protein